jgi:molecular chaperone DnaK (HSP70)
LLVCEETKKSLTQLACSRIFDKNIKQKKSVIEKIIKKEFEDHINGLFNNCFISIQKVLHQTESFISDIDDLILVI